VGGMMGVVGGVALHGGGSGRSDAS
jgi:hypothetical protein